MGEPTQSVPIQNGEGGAHVGPTANCDPFNVYVRNLPPTITDDALRGLFAFYGNIMSHRVMVDKKTGQSLCFGFVRYDTKESAADAIKALNGKDIGGQRLICKYAELPRQEQVRNELNNVYVKPLPTTVTVDGLRNLFSRFGEIVQATILSNPDGTSRGIGFVRYVKHEDARYAIAEMHGTTPPGHTQQLVVKFAETEAEKNIKRTRAAMGAAYPPFPGTPQFAPRGPPVPRYPVRPPAGPLMGARGGPIQNGVGMRPPVPPHVPAAVAPSYGYAGQEAVYGQGGWSDGGYGPQDGYYGEQGYDASAYGYDASGAYYGTEAAGYGGYAQSYGGGPDRRASYGQGHSQAAAPRTSRYQPYGAPAQSNPAAAAPVDERNLYITPLPLDLDDDGLRHYFSPFGAIESVKVMMDRNTGRSKGFGFVKYFDPKHARAALESMSGLMIGPNRISVSFKKASNKV